MDIFVIGWKRKEEVVEHLYMTLGFHIEGFFHGGAVDQYRHVAVQYIYFLLCICNHRPCRPDTAHADDDAAGKEERTDDADQFDFIFQILDNHTLLSLYS